jgi:hypothetical protein
LDKRENLPKKSATNDTIMAEKIHGRCFTRQDDCKSSRKFLEKRALKKTLGMETGHWAVREKHHKNCGKLPESIGQRSMKLRTIGSCEGAIRQRIGSVFFVGCLEH